MTTILVWNCGNNDLPYARQEASQLESLRSADCDVVVAGHSLEWDGLASLAAAVRPTIFHFIGHGDSGGQIDVRERGGHFGRPAKDVIRVVRAASTNLEGVYLSTCFTVRTGPELLEALPPAAGWAVGTVSEVDDELATQFSEKFYQHLIGNAACPQQAYEVAKAYAAADWGDEIPYGAWFVPSPLPSVDQMAHSIVAGLRGIFNRPAFMEPMRNEISMRHLDVALQDVSHALGTGQVLSRRDRTPIVAVSFPVEWLQDPQVQGFVKSARSGLTVTRKALGVVAAGTKGMDRVIGNAFNLDPSVARDEWMKRINRVDRARNQILKAANSLLVRNDLPPFPLIPLSYGQAEIEVVREHTGGH